MPRKRIYKFKRALQGYMNKIRGNNKLSKELYDKLMLIQAIILIITD